MKFLEFISHLIFYISLNSLKHFDIGMYDMGLTLNDTQVHLLAKLLDRDNSGEIDYTEISKGLQYAKWALI